MVDVAEISSGDQNLAARVRVGTQVDLTGLEHGLADMRRRLQDFDQQMSGSFKRASQAGAQGANDMATALGKAAQAADKVDWKGPDFKGAAKEADTFIGTAQKAAKGVDELKKFAVGAGEATANAMKKAAAGVEDLKKKLDQNTRSGAKSGDGSGKIAWNDRSVDDARNGLKGVTQDAAKTAEVVKELAQETQTLGEVMDVVQSPVDELADSLLKMGARGQGALGTLLRFARSAGGIGTGIAVAAIGGYATIRLYEMHQQQIAATIAASTGLGKAVALSNKEMEASAVAGSEAASISIRDARAMQVAFLRTGRIAAETYAGIIGLSRDFAATMGTDLNGARDQLADLFANPAEGAKKLYYELNLIDETTARQVIKLANQNRLLEAQQLLLKGMPALLVDADQATSYWARTWQMLKDTAVGALDAIGKGLDNLTRDQTVQEELDAAATSAARLQKVIEDYQSGKRISLPMPLSDLQKQLDIEKQRVSVLRDLLGLQDETFQKEKEYAQARAAGAAALLTAKQSPALAEQNRIGQLTNEIAKMESGLNDTLSISGRKEVNEALEAKKRVLEALNAVEARSVELTRLGVAIQYELNPVLRANLAAERERLALADQEISKTEIERKANLARLQIIESTVQAAGANAEQMKAEAGIRASLNSQVASGSMSMVEAERALRVELELRPLIIAAAVAEGEERKRLLEVINQLRDAYAAMDRETARSAAQSNLAAMRDRVELMKAELAVMDQGQIARSAAIQQLQAEQQIRRLGIDLYGEEAEAIRAVAAETILLGQAMARLQLQQEVAFEMRQLFRSAEDQAIAARLNAAGLTDDLQSQEAQMLRLLEQAKRTKDSWEDIFETARSGIDQLVDALFDGGKSIEEVLKDIGRQFAKLIFDMAVTNPLKNWLTGSNLNTIADLGIFKTGLEGASSGRGGGFGGVLGNLLGAQKAVASMQVQAGTVIISGGIGGIPGVPGAGGAGGVTGEVLGGVPGVNTTSAPASAAAAVSAANDNIQEAVEERVAATVETVTSGLEEVDVDVGKVFDPSEWQDAFAERIANIDENMAKVLDIPETLDLSKAAAAVNPFGDTMADRLGGMPEYGDILGDKMTGFNQFFEAQRLDAVTNGLPLGGDMPFGNTFGTTPFASLPGAVPEGMMAPGGFGGALGGMPDLSSLNESLETATDNLSKLSETVAPAATGLTDSLSQAADSATGLGNSALPSLTAAVNSTAAAETVGVAAKTASSAADTTAATSATLKSAADTTAATSVTTLGVAAQTASTGITSGGLFSSIGSFFGFSKGGFTGAGNDNEPRGIVHANEVVWNREDVARWGGAAAVEAMRRGRAPRGGGGGGSGVVVPHGAGGGGGGGVTREMIASIVSELADKLQFNNKNVNVLDPRIVGDFLAGPAGEKVIMNVIRRNGSRKAA